MVSHSYSDVNEYNVNLTVGDSKVNHSTTQNVTVVNFTGEGTSSSPYEVSSCKKLQEMNYSLGSDYVLTKSLNCSDTENWNSGKGFRPIGTSSNGFDGSFDGQGNTISGLYINRSSRDFVGLFGTNKWDNADGSINRTGLVDVNISGGSYVGGIVGHGSVSESFITGVVKGSGDRVGGIVGWGSGSPSSYSLANVSSEGQYVGGLSGISTYSSTISTSYSTGKVNGSQDVGGLLGYNNGGTVSDSYWDTVESSDSDATEDGYPILSAFSREKQLRAQGIYSN